MSQNTTTIRDIEELYSEYVEATTPAQQDAILHKVRDLYGMSQASHLLRSVRKSRGYYNPTGEPTQQSMNAHNYVQYD